ncbi:suppressor of fused domain protein [Bacillus arachidis]|uniref:Suppressor of fused domain protein n=1 Tax=Bacillus arachidis TaxID=2819290 RepID=A0ABS3P3U4_9BACI|nr:suppressor of fused domain protein [Bacillus arachidis]MBO1627422.1 suppressor of fused domain protein [Bacillus arachidis]
MRSNAEAFIDRLEELFGEVDVIKKINTKNGDIPIHVFFYRDLPEEGMMTSITYGLSEANHPNWKNGKPEIILTLETQDESWGLATAYFASQFKGEKNFSYGSLFTLDTPISKESEMVGFFVFAPSILSKEYSEIKTPEGSIHLVGMYPIYSEEIKLYQTIGLEQFWRREGFDLYNVKRKKLV